MRAACKPLNPQRCCSALRAVGLAPQPSTSRSASDQLQRGLEPGLAPCVIAHNVYYVNSYLETIAPVDWRGWTSTRDGALLSPSEYSLDARRA